MCGKKKLMGLLAVTVLLLAVPVMAGSKGAVSVSLDQSAYLNGKLLSKGAYHISWESHSPEVDVTFWNQGQRFQAHGKIIERDAPNFYTGVVLQKDSEGREVLKEIRVQGKRFSIVLD